MLHPNYPPFTGPHPHQAVHLHHHHQAPLPLPSPQQHHHQQQPQHHHHHLLHSQQHALHHDVYAPQPQHYAPLQLGSAYRPLQIPLQQQHSSPVVAPEQQQHQQLALAQQQATTPAFQPRTQAPDPGLQLLHHNVNHSQHPVQAAYSQRRERSQQSSMAYQPSDEEMAEMQRLSAAYETDHTVGVNARVVARVCRASCPR